jgi:hypothetical protein
VDNYIIYIKYELYIIIHVYWKKITVWAPMGE